MTPNREATLAERKELHTEKMRNKSARRKRWHSERMVELAKFGPSPRFAKMPASGYSPIYGSIAKFNRHTGKPHEHARQTARIARTA